MVLKVFQVMVILSKEKTRCTGFNNKIDISFMQFFLTFWVQFFGIFYIVLLGLSDPNAITCSPLKYIYFFYIFFYILREEIERMRLKVSLFFLGKKKKRKRKRLSSNYPFKLSISILKNYKMSVLPHPFLEFKLHESHTCSYCVFVIFSILWACDCRFSFACGHKY